MDDINVTKPLGHWVGFELLCNIGAIAYIISQINKYAEMLIIVFLILLIVRAIILIRLWLKLDTYVPQETTTKGDIMPEDNQKMIDIFNNIPLNELENIISNKSSDYVPDAIELAKSIYDKRAEENSTS